MDTGWTDTGQTDTGQSGLTDLEEGELGGSIHVHSQASRVMIGAGLDAVSVGPTTMGSAVVEFPLDGLRAGLSPRSVLLSDRHVAVLVEVPNNWPPVVVRRRDLAVVDGHHRVEAARRLGMSSIAGTYFDGSDDDAYIEAVSRNIRHGLVLPIEDRKVAAAKILAKNLEWSDRRVAKICGLSPNTVCSVRNRLAQPACPSVGDGQLDRRIGHDGRSRPADPIALRSRIAEAVKQDPKASLRAVARLVGASPETVRSVRDRLQAPSPAHSIPDPKSVESVPAALCSTPSGQEFLAWFSRTRVDADDWATYASCIPLSRVYEVADEARRRAASWQAFADRVEARARSAT